MEKYRTYYRRTAGQAEDKPDLMVWITPHTSVIAAYSGIDPKELAKPTHNLSTEEEYAMTHVRPSELAGFLEKRNALFQHPTIEAATAYWNEQGLPKPVRKDVPLATVHKARLQWLGATDAMIAESMAWLTKHDYETTTKGAPPLTPEKRDADRVELGMPPLGQVS